MPIFYTNTIISNTIQITGSVLVSGSLNLTSSSSTNMDFTGSVLGTSSFTLNSATASFITASNIFNGNASSFVISSSTSLTSSNFTKANYTNRLKFSEGVAAARALGSDILFETVGTTAANLAAGRPMANATATGTMILITYPCTITGVCYLQGSAGAYTASNYNGIALYKLTDSSTYTLVASSSNNGDLWKAASSTFVTASFTSTYSADIGIYAALALYNITGSATSNPNIVGIRKIPSANISSINTSRFIGSNTLLLQAFTRALTTSPPSTITSVTTLGNVAPMYFALY